MSRKIISIFLVAVMILSVMTTGVFADNTTIIFTDVDASTEEGAAIYKLAENGIVNGNGDGTFTPNNYVTRAELCKMVNNIWKLTTPAQQGFKDVTEKDWYYNHVLIGKEAGYIKGFDDGTFKGNSYVTREQACAIVCRVSGLEDAQYSGTISDAVSDWAINYVNKILGNGLMAVETGNKFRATENMKRGELAKVLSNFITVETDDKTPGNSTGGITIGGGNTNTGSNNNGTTKPEIDYTAENATVVANLTTAKTELTANRELFTVPEKEIVDIVISVLNSLITDQSKYKITTETVYLKHTEKIMEALDKYSKLSSSGRGSFVSKISQLNSQVFNFLQDFFGVDFSDIENELK